MRIVSLLPSATESLACVGAHRMLVGRSHECDHPASVTHLPVLTRSRTASGAPPGEIHRQVAGSLAEGSSLYHLDADRLRELAPDLILTQDLCEVCSIDLAAVRRVAASMDPEPEILSLDPHSFEDVLDDVLRVGAATGHDDEAREAVRQLRARFFDAADHVTPYVEGPSVLFLEWTDPPFCAGHWTVQLIERAGGRHHLNPTRPMPNAGDGAGGQQAHRVAEKSRRVTPEEIIGVAPSEIVVCPCGIGLDEAEQHTRALLKHDWFRELPAVRDGRIAIVDGNQHFNRPGPRLVEAYEWLVGYLNDRPDRMPADFPWRRMHPSQHGSDIEH